MSKETNGGKQGTSWGYAKEPPRKRSSRKSVVAQQSFAETKRIFVDVLSTTILKLQPYNPGNKERKVPLYCYL